MEFERGGGEGLTYVQERPSPRGREHEGSKSTGGLGGNWAFKITSVGKTEKQQLMGGNEELAGESS